MKVTINNRYSERSCGVDSGGFSMIELVIVMAIIATLVAIASMSSRMINKARVSNAIRQVMGDLQAARLDAMVSGPSGTADEMQFMRGAGIRLISTSQYATFRFNDCNQNYQYDTGATAGCATSTEESNTKIIGFPSGVVMQRVAGGVRVNPTNSVNDIYLFDHLGLLRDYQWNSYQWNSGTSSLVIVIQWPNLVSKCIFIRGNRIREGTWNDTSATCSEQ